MVSVDFRVMAHPKRAELVDELLGQLQADDRIVTWDEKNDRWDTGHRAWDAIDRNADFGCIIQDDVVVCRDLIRGLEKGLEYVPTEAIVQPYVGQKGRIDGWVKNSVKVARKDDSSWLVMKNLHWGVAIILPTHTIDAMLEWCDRRAYPNYDLRISEYFKSKMHWPTYYTWPSLVQHRDVESLVGHGSGRVAHNFIGTDGSALDVDWSKGVTFTRGVSMLAHQRRSLRSAPSVR